MRVPGTGVCFGNPGFRIFPQSHCRTSASVSSWIVAFAWARCTPAAPDTGRATPRSRCLWSPPYRAPARPRRCRWRTRTRASVFSGRMARAPRWPWTRIFGAAGIISAYASSPGTRMPLESPRRLHGHSNLAVRRNSHWQQSLHRMAFLAAMIRTSVLGAVDADIGGRFAADAACQGYGIGHSYSASLLHYWFFLGAGWASASARPGIAALLYPRSGTPAPCCAARSVMYCRSLSRFDEFSASTPISRSPTAGF